MQNVSQQFGDTEFVGGLIDSLTSNRYFPGEGGNKGMGALAGESTGLGPDSIDGRDQGSYNWMVNNGWSKKDAERYAGIDPKYQWYVNGDDLQNKWSGGRYEGPTR